MIQFDFSIYPPEIIKEAVKDFNEIAEIKTTFHEFAAECTIITSVYDAEQTEKELGNYVLDKTVSVGRVL